MSILFNNKVFKILFGILKALFIIIVLLYLSFIIVQRVTGNNSVFGYRVFTIATGSMEGVYNINDVIAVKDYDTSKLKVGDDIAYKGSRGGLEGKMITHRIVKIEKSEKGGRIFITKGVKAPMEDPSIEENQILGKVVGIVPVVTQLNHVVKSQLGFFLLVFCPLVLIIVLEVLQTITDIKVENNEIQKIEKKDKKKKEESDEEVTEDEKIEENDQEETNNGKEKLEEKEVDEEKEDNSEDDNDDDSSDDNDNSDNDNDSSDDNDNDSSDDNNDDSDEDEKKEVDEIESEPKFININIDMSQEQGFVDSNEVKEEAVLEQSSDEGFIEPDLVVDEPVIQKVEEIEIL